MFAISFSTCNRLGKRTEWILIRLRGCAGWSGSMVVANALCWFCRDEAQMLLDAFYALVDILFDTIQLFLIILNRIYSFKLL
jgi:hypothetical protein